MSAETSRILAEAAGTKLCDVVVIGITPDGSVNVDWSGTTIASLLMFLKLAEREALVAWDAGVDLHRKGEAA
jgi:hypothetical protein